MERKLTLRLDEKLIDHAKQHAEKSGTSVSNMFANFVAALDSLEAKDKSDTQTVLAVEELSPLTRSLVGLLKADREDGESRALYRKHLEEKYR